MTDPEIDAVIRLVNEQHAQLATKQDLEMLAARYKRWLILAALAIVFSVWLIVTVWH